jgi:hypothetical protein
MRTVRDLVSSVLVALGMLAAVVGLASQMANETLFNSARVVHAAPVLANNAVIRSALASSLANALSPIDSTAGIYIPTPDLQQVIDEVLASPAAHAQLVAAIAHAGLRIIGRWPGPIELGGPTVSTLVASDLAPYSSALAEDLADTTLTIGVPGAALPNLGGVAHASTQVAVPALGLAAIALAAGLALAEDRERAARRIGWFLIWCTLALGVVFWLLPSVVLPAIGLSWAVIGRAVLAPGGTGNRELIVGTFVAGILLVVGARAGSHLATR